MSSETHVALCSGGMDSAVSTHVAMTWGEAEIVVYLDTGTGLEENRKYVEDLCEEFGWQLWTLRTHESYEEKVEEHGFPGPSRHGIMYRSLKERQIQKLAAVAGDDLHCWTGVRSLESSRRMSNVEPDSEQAGGRWYWHAPIHDWNKQQCKDYLESFDIPRNDLWDTLGRSGDCFCGCYGNPEEKLDLRAAGCDYHAEWIEGLEEDVETGDETECWAWGAMSNTERRAARVDEKQMTLCSKCEIRADGGSKKGDN